MGLASAMSTALTGLTAAETTIDVVGNNLANSNTVGFKASDVTFATQFLQTRSLGSGPTETSGGTNPRQVGLGTMVADITPDFSQGTVEISSNSTDMAIQGEGFFIVEGRSNDAAYTRNGVFKMNSDNELTTATGNRLLGYGVNDDYEIQTTQLEPITIPLGSKAVSKTTENVWLEGALIPNGTLADAAKIIQTDILGDGSYTYPLTAPTTELSGPPDISGVAQSAVFDAAGLVPDGDYYYRLVFSDGAPGGAIPLEGTPSAATTVAVTVANPGTNAVSFSGLTSMAAGNYQYINFYRSTTPGGTYSYVGNTLATNDVYVDTAAAGTTTLNDTTLIGQYKYYVAYGKSGSDPSRPGGIIELSSVSGGRIHLTDLPAAVPNPNGWDRWVLYRNAPNTPAGDNRYFEVTQIPFTSGNDFSDNVPDSDLYTSESVHTTEIDMDGPRIQKSTLLSDVYRRVGSTYTQVFSTTGTLLFGGTKGGASVTAEGTYKEMTVGTTSTVGQLLEFMGKSLGIQPSDATTGIPESRDLVTGGADIPPGGDVIDGRMQLTGNNGTANAIDITTLQWASGTDTITMPFNKYQDGEGESVKANFPVYDSLGISCNVNLTAVLESKGSTSTTYRWFADSWDNQLASGDPNTAVGTGTIVFDGLGNVASVTQDRVTIYRENIASNSPLQFALNFDAISGLAVSSSELAMSKQDGSPPGTLTSFIIGEDGLVTGVFSNGGTRDLGQIRLARFANPAGLEQLGENLYMTGINSGLPIQGNPGQSGIGSITAGAVELSNADIGSNLIDLILASTMYRGNTRVITTAQQMLDELMQLRR